MKNICSTISYIFIRKRLTLILLGFAGSITAYLLYHSNQHGNLIWYTDIVDPYVSVVTLVVAMGLWISNANWERKQRLDFRLTVQFIYQNRTIARCEEAYLAGEGDIRAWGQQIGAQMLRTRFLKMQPYINQTGPDIKYDTQTKKEFKLYTICFYLKEKPALDSFSTEQSAAKDTFIQEMKTKCLVWKRIYDSDKNPLVKEEWLNYAQKSA